MKTSWTPLALAGLLFVAACDDVRRAERTLISRDTAEATADSSDRDTPASSVGPAYKTVELMREGTRDTMRLRLIGSARGFQPQFFTYAPVDMIFEPLDARLGQGFKFTANFAGQRRNDAFVLMLAYPAGTTEAVARANMDTYIAGREEIAAGGRRQPWTLLEHTFRGTTHAGDPINGWVGLGRHNNRFFIFATEYPPEFSEGMGVRADQILKEWRWLPENTPLRQ